VVGGERGLTPTMGRVKDFIYGLLFYDFTLYALRTRASIESLFLLVTLGDLIGLPIMPPYYSLRILPYVVPNIATWKRRMLREKDLLETDVMGMMSG